MSLTPIFNPFNYYINVTINVFVSIEAESEEQSYYDMKKYLDIIYGKLPEEIIVEVKRELNAIKEHLIKESHCQIYLPGEKSVDLYDSILDDLIKEGFSVGNVNIRPDGVIIRSPRSEEDCYILLDDSSKTGTEIETIIGLMDDIPKKIVTNVSTKESMELIINRFGLNTNQIITVNEVNSLDDYREIILRNKVFGYANSGDGSIGFSEMEYEYITDIKQEKFIILLEDSSKEVMQCDKICLIKDETLNLKTIERMTKYTHECDCAKHNCMEWYNKFNQDSIIPVSMPKFLIFIFRITRTDVGYKLGIVIDYNFDVDTNIIKNYKECCLYELTQTCGLVNTEDIKDNELLSIIVGRSCVRCIDNNILDNTKNNIIERMKLKISDPDLMQTT